MTDAFDDNGPAIPISKVVLFVLLSGSISGTLVGLPFALYEHHRLSALVAEQEAIIDDSNAFLAKWHAEHAQRHTDFPPPPPIPNELIDRSRRP